MRSIRAVWTLLKAGVDVNHVGDPNGASWNYEEFMLSPFRKLYGWSPLVVVKIFVPMSGMDKQEWMSQEDWKGMEVALGEEIKRILVEHGGVVVERDLGGGSGEEEDSGEGEGDEGYTSDEGRASSGE